MPNGYRVETIDVEYTAACECGDCDWKGLAQDLEDIDTCVLTAGDPSPAGRCPECGSLSYVC